jgi:hypothetical protein
MGKLKGDNMKKYLVKALALVNSGKPKASFKGFDEELKVPFSARADLFVIREAWNRGMNVEDLADGYGLGLGTCGGDWSGIRDSSEEQVAKMRDRAVKFLEKKGVK